MISKILKFIHTKFCKHEYSKVIDLGCFKDYPVFINKSKFYYVFGNVILTYEKCKKCGETNISKNAISNDELSIYDREKKFKELEDDK